FETCVAALENWQRTEQDGELRIGHSLLRGPIEHDRVSGTCRIDVRLARGPMRPLLRMRLNIDRWSWPPARTALELIPCDRVRPTAADFRAGHLTTAPRRSRCPPARARACRLSRRGNRRHGHAIHMAAITQIRSKHSQGRA